MGIFEDLQASIEDLKTRVTKLESVHATVATAYGANPMGMFAIGQTHTDPKNAPPSPSALEVQAGLTKEE